MVKKIIQVKDSIPWVRCASGNVLLFLDIEYIVYIFEIQYMKLFTAQSNWHLRSISTVCRHASVHVPGNLAEKLAFKQEHWFVAVYKIWHVFSPDNLSPDKLAADDIGIWVWRLIIHLGLPLTPYLTVCHKFVLQSVLLRAACSSQKRLRKLDHPSPTPTSHLEKEHAIFYNKWDLDGCHTGCQKTLTCSPERKNTPFISVGNHLRNVSTGERYIWASAG